MADAWQYTNVSSNNLTAAKQAFAKAEKKKKEAEARGDYGAAAAAITEMAKQARLGDKARTSLGQKAQNTAYIQSLMKEAKASADKYNAAKTRLAAPMMPSHEPTLSKPVPSGSSGGGSIDANKLGAQALARIQNMPESQRPTTPYESYKKGTAGTPLAPERSSFTPEQAHQELVASRGGGYTSKVAQFPASAPTGTSAPGGGLLNQPGFNLGDYTGRAIAGAVQAGSPNAWASPELMSKYGTPTVATTGILPTSQVSTNAMTQPGDFPAGVTPSGGNGMGEGAQPAAQPATQPAADQGMGGQSQNTMGGVQPGVEQPGAGSITPPDWEAERKSWLDEIDRATQQNAALVATWMNQMDTQLGQLQTQIMDMYKQQGTNLDPATLAALTEIRDQVKMRRQQLMEEMNRRGLLQSGIWLEMEDRILKGQMSEEEKLLAGRLADIQNQMINATMQFANQRANLMNTQFQNLMGNQQWANEQRLNATNTISQRQDEWNRWWGDYQAQVQRDAQTQAQRQYENELNRSKAAAGFTGTIPEGYPGAGGPTYEAQQAEADKQARLREAQAKAATPPKPTITEQTRNATADAYGAVDQAKSKGLSNEQVKGNIEAQTAEMVRQGVDPQKILQYLEERYPEEQQGTSWYTNLDKSLGGWLPFGVPR